MNCLFENKSGFAALITVISLGGAILLLSLAAIIIVYFANLNTKSFIDSLKVFYAAQSGIQDALIKLERNKDYRESFNLSIEGIDSVSVSFAELEPPDKFIIVSTSTLSQIRKKIETIVEINDTTGLITPSSTVEKAF